VRRSGTGLSIFLKIFETERGARQYKPYALLRSVKQIPD